MRWPKIAKTIKKSEDTFFWHCALPVYSVLLAVFVLTLYFCR